MMNGVIEVQLNGRRVTVLSGPYRDKPDEVRGVKLAKELDLPCDVDLPIRDYCIPSVSSMVRGLREAFEILGEDQIIYVGCFGGIGRTGMFLALMVRFMALHRTLKPAPKTGFRLWWAKLTWGREFEDITPEDQLMRMQPVNYVRANVNPHAVETTEQELFVTGFPVGPLYDAVMGRV